MRLVVADAGPLVHLSEIEAIELLRSLGEMHVPEAVEQEVSVLLESWSSSRPDWVYVTSLDSSRNVESRAWEQAGLLDRGEADAIGLARQLSASWLLTDDASARLMAEALGIETHGSLGVVLFSASQGTVTKVEAEALLTRLANSSLWVSDRVLSEARAALEELFS